MLRRKSLRRGIWFKALSKIERGLIDLTLRCVQRVRSPILINVLQTILLKLSQAVHHFFTWRLEQIGRPIAKNLSEVAVSWGVKRAENWPFDNTYLQCLGLNYLSASMRR